MFITENLNQEEFETIKNASLLFQMILKGLILYN